MHRLALLPVLILLAACGPMNSVDTDDLAERIDEIVAQHPEAVVSVSVRDPSTNAQLDRGADRLFHAASTMKVPVMIEVFRRARAGEFSLRDSLEVRNRFRSIVDGSPFAIEDDTDDAIYERLGSQMAIRDLVYNMITISSNLATNLLIDLVSADSVQATCEALGTRHLRTLRGVEDLKAYARGLNNQTASGDLALLMHALMEGRAVSAEDDGEMVAVLAEQRLNEMIPVGLPASVRVAHKTGQISAIHHDMAIVYPADAAPYVLVILIEGITDDTVSAALGAEIAGAVHEALRD